MLRIHEDLLHTLGEYAERNYPEEGAGLVLGSLVNESRLALELLPVENEFRAEERTRRYLIKPEVMMQAERQAEEKDLEILGVFHSHPDHPARPSEYDRGWALPWYSYLIASVRSGRAQEIRAWRLSDSREFKEEEMHILRAGNPKEIE
jgi:proteasome lid subunit RPN8/RPN11